MKIKTGILVILLLTGSISLANDAIIHRNYDTNDNSAVEYSNYGQKNTIRYEAELVEPAVREIKQQLRRDPENYSLYANLADIYIKSKQYDLALDNFVKLYELKRDNLLGGDVTAIIEKMSSVYRRVSRKDGGLYLNMAVMSLILDSNSAIDFAVTGADRTSNTEMTKKVLDLVYNSNQDPEKAINVCEKILVRNPNDIEVRMIKAAYHTKLNQTSQAIEEYTKVLSINSSDDDIRYELYKLLATQKKIDDKEMLRHLYGMQTPFVYEQAYVSLAELLLKHSDFGDAKFYAEKLMKKYEKNPNSYILMAEIYKREGKVKDAYNTLKLARDKADDDATIAKYNVMLAKLSDEPVKEAENLILNGLYNQAIEVLDSANPEALYVMLTQAKANYLAGNKQKAFEFLNKAMSLYPENSDVYCAFGSLYIKENDTETARSYINHSLKINKNNQNASELLDKINSAEANVYKQDIINAFEAQNYSEAMRLVNEAMAIDSKSADLYFYKSLIYIALNNYSASTSTLYKCIELNKQYIDAYFYLGAAFDNLGDKPNALVNYKKYLELSKGKELGSGEKIDYAKARILKLQ